jgi:ADP-dependent NAD(P)H-hydrate dehydratase / NAD(P)H-hydrate epimerase
MILVTASEMQEMDRRTIDEFGVPGRVLMENAGRGATRFFLETLPDWSGKTVAVAAGRGNNGGDGFVIARYLAQRGVKVTVYLLSTVDRVTGDAAANLALLPALGVPVREIADADGFAARRTAMAHAHIWVDAIFGTGLNSNVRGLYRDAIDFINRQGRPVLSVDLPSGLQADTGQPCGVAIQATATATFAFAKTGHMLYPGLSHTGRLEIIDIGIPPHISEAVGPAQGLLTTGDMRRVLTPRPAETHKGTNGHVLVVAGATGKTGAAALTAMSAVRAGAGLVTLAVAESLNPVLETQVLEAMTVPLPEAGGRLTGECIETVLDLLRGKQCLALGPGIGTAAETRELVVRLVRQCPVPMVIDADGLNCLAGQLDLLQKAHAPVILTPHPGEMARLAETTTADVQKDRIGCARQFARRHGVHLVLKGARTVVADPNGRVQINPTGNAGMATGGMGDVLTGLVAGLVAQGLSPENAACAGTFLHGAAADALALSMGPVGYAASEVMNAVPGQIAETMSPENHQDLTRPASGATL